MIFLPRVDVGLIPTLIVDVDQPLRGYGPTRIAPHPDHLSLSWPACIKKPGTEPGWNCGITRLIAACCSIWPYYCTTITPFIPTR